jgi:hypothetical protein
MVEALERVLNLITRDSPARKQAFSGVRIVFDTESVGNQIDIDRVWMQSGEWLIG